MIDWGEIEKLHPASIKMIITTLEDMLYLKEEEE